MKIVRESTDDIKYTKVLLGGSIGKSLRDVRELEGEEERGQIFDTREEAAASAKQSNKNLSPGEKKYYGLKWVVAEIKDGYFTGK